MYAHFHLTTFSRSSIKLYGFLNFMDSRVSEMWTFVIHIFMKFKYVVPLVADEETSISFPSLTATRNKQKFCCCFSSSPNNSLKKKTVFDEKHSRTKRRSLLILHYTYISIVNNLQQQRQRII